jgi:hypothetical protein
MHMERNNPDSLRTPTTEMRIPGASRASTVNN